MNDDFKPEVSGRSTGPTGLLIIRAWTEQGSSTPLRAQLRISSDVTAGIDRTLTTSRVDEVCAVVRDWLDSIVSHPQS